MEWNPGQHLSNTNRFMRRMSTSEYQAQVLAEITRDNRAVRQNYVGVFSAEALEFSVQMGDALTKWRDFYVEAQGDERRMKVLALAYTAMSLQVGSMKLFLMGHQIASGNLMRQVLETIALTYLCSSSKLKILEDFDEGTYHTHKAIADAVHNATVLGLNKASVSKLKEAQKFYHKFSHPTKMTIGTLESFTDEGIYLGAAFDTGKLKYYKIEIANRLRLSELFVGFIQSVHRNLDVH